MDVTMWVEKPLLSLVEVDFFMLSLTEYRYYPEIPWLSYLPVHMRVLEFAWWSRDWIDITCSLLMCTVRTKCAGNDAASNLHIHVELIICSSRVYKLVTMTMT